MLRKLMLVALLGVAAPAFAAGDSRVKIAVLDLQARGVDAALVQSAGTLIASELNKLEVFKVISREDIRNMLSFEKDKQGLGCEANEACLAEIGGALGVEYIIAGSLAQIGDTMVLSLALNNTKTATVENRVSESVTGKGDALIGAISRNAKVLVSKILKGREGYLVLTVAEAGAVVKIDGQIRGTTPVKGRMTLSWGPHLLEVEKAGFIAYNEDISVPNKQVLAKNVALVPSNDFIDGYENRAKKMRMGAWITSGVAGAAVASALIFNNWSSRTEAAFARAKNSYALTNSQDDYNRMKKLSSDGSTQVALARIGLGVGVVAAAAAVYFWVAGDDPHKYESFKEAAPETPAKSSLLIAPADGGAALTFAGRF
jgi:TolB-like protein